MRKTYLLYAEKNVIQMAKAMENLMTASNTDRAIETRRKNLEPTANLPNRAWLEQGARRDNIPTRAR